MILDKLITNLSTACRHRPPVQCFLCRLRGIERVNTVYFGNFQNITAYILYRFLGNNMYTILIIMYIEVITPDCRRSLVCFYFFYFIRVYLDTSNKRQNYKIIIKEMNCTISCQVLNIKIVDFITFKFFKKPKLYKYCYS